MKCSARCCTSLDPHCATESDSSSMVTSNGLLSSRSAATCSASQVRKVWRVVRRANRRHRRSVNEARGLKCRNGFHMTVFTLRIVAKYDMLLTDLYEDVQTPVPPPDVVQA